MDGQSVAAALVQRFLSTIQTAFDDIEMHLCMRGCRGRTGGPDPSKNHKTIGFLSNGHFKSHVQFLIDLTVSTQIQNVFDHHKTEQGGNEIPTNIDSKKWGLNFAEVDKYPTPLKDNWPHLCNHISGQVVTTVVIVADSNFNSEKMGMVFIVSLPDGF